ncbi:hypothetical protein PZ78_12180 [Vreelandella venusta]|nr:hypothetical protein CLM76_04725 [Halomonas hydrothermalis]KHJ50672.1 hypothetical protein PZ78_12180 [Halomonas hydrothermalis]
MNGQDQAAGLRKWADLQRQQRGEQPDEPAADAPSVDTSTSDKEVAQTNVGTDASETAPKEVASAAASVAAPRPTRTLVIVGLSSAGALHVDKVKGRLAQWASLGRQWAGDPQEWDVKVASPEAGSMAALAHHPHWALWVSSDAEAFASMYRALRQMREQGGPRRLLALHEPHLPRQGLLDNLRDAAAHYLQIELLLLAR